MALNFNRQPGPGETRACIDPWRFTIVRSSGDVSLCCRSEVLGNLKETPLSDILESPAAVRMRERLLLGDLPEDCVVCSERGVTTLEGLRRDVEFALFEEGRDEVEDLRRQLYEHGEVCSELRRYGEGLRTHASALERERDGLREHASRLEEERQRQAEHLANLEREASLPLPRLIAGRLRSSIRRLLGRRENP